VRLSQLLARVEHGLAGSDDPEIVARAALDAVASERLGAADAS
jgi:hypothetical protein